MPVSLEMYVLINLGMNFITIGVIARSRGRVRWGAVAFASAFGALYAVAMQTELFPQLGWPPLRVVLGLLLVACSMRVESMRDLLAATLWLAGATLFMGGVQFLLRGLFHGPSALATLVGALGGGILLVAALDARRQQLSRFDVQLMMRMGNRQVKLSALIDTGNRLHEPVSGLPVLIVEQRRIQKLLPAGFDARRAAEHLPPGYRLVGYGALGGGGRMAVFRPDELLLSYGDGWMMAPDLWVAVYPGEMPGRVHALAPGVIGCIQPMKKRERRTGINHEMRGNGRW